MTLKSETQSILSRLGVEPSKFQNGDLPVSSPVTGEMIANVKMHTADEAKTIIEQAHESFLQWRVVPAPKRGELIRVLGEELRNAKDDLGRLVSLEAGKILTEGLGEVQEMIDICEFAVGLSRQLYGLTIASERPGHRMMETWHPLGVVGIISAFNFPVAVWSWNAAIAIVAGNSTVWKPSEKTPLTALACQALMERAISKCGGIPAGLSSLIIGKADIGETLVEHQNVPLISATGSTRMGRIVGPKVAQRFGRTILELGGNNASIICSSADLDMSLRACAFGAIGTAGQRCTSLRRLFVHEDVYDELIPRLKSAYKTVAIGNPLDKTTLLGPLIDRDAFENMQTALSAAKAMGGETIGGTRIKTGDEDAYYVRPALVEMSEHEGIVTEETFAPILYVFKFSDLDDAIRLQNSVKAGLSSSIFTLNVREAEKFLSAAGSDCGIANVNIGTSGAEIGGAFGGEKETGGGRESGSDSWKAYMRRATNTVNYSDALPLAQGVSFDVG